MSMHRLLVLSALSAALAACSNPAPPAGSDSSPTGVTAAAAETATATAAAQAQLASLDEATLRSKASAALAGQQVYTPAGTSAIDYYLALRDKAPVDASTNTTLAELMPYVLIGTEQAIARNDVVEGARLLALMARVDAKAPALPRLRTELAKAEQDGVQALADSAKAATLARETAEAERAQAITAAADAERLRVAAARALPSAPAAASATPAPVPTTSSARTAAAGPASTTQVGASTPPPVASATPAPAPTQVVRTPRLLSDAAPRYPRVALSRKIEGSVQLDFTIQPDGSVNGVRVTSSNPTGVFDEAAIAAASRWRFETSGQTHQSGRTLAFRLPAGS